MIQELARYWATDYDWRRCEAKLNALPQFMTEIDELDIHFIHGRSDRWDERSQPPPRLQAAVWQASVPSRAEVISSRPMSPMVTFA